MATIKQIKTQIEKANALGRKNLTDKGVSVEEIATTYDIMKSIADVSGGGGTEEIENLIDESGVLEDTEGTVTEKVEELIDKAEELEAFMSITAGSGLFKGVKTFPAKAIVNLPNVTTVFQAFSYWDTEPIPIVEEITVNAPKATNIGQMFECNKGAKKVVLDVSDEIAGMSSVFNQATKIEEIVLDFSTKNIKDYNRVFNMCSKLKKIVGVLDFSAATNVDYMFFYCSNLEEVTFEPNTLSLSMSLNTSSKLTNESVQSIIDGLKTLEEGATAKTLTLNKAIVLTDEQKATINAKGWTLAQ